MAERAVLTSTCVGTIDPARALRRPGSRPGHELAVTGSLGAAAAALAAGPGARSAWRRRERRPEPEDARLCCG